MQSYLYTKLLLSINIPTPGASNMCMLKWNFSTHRPLKSYSPKIAYQAMASSSTPLSKEERSHFSSLTLTYRPTP